MNIISCCPLSASLWHSWSCSRACFSHQSSRLSKELQFCSGHELLRQLKISRELQQKSILKISQLWQKNLSGPHMSKLYLLPSTHWPSPTWEHHTFALFIAINFSIDFLVCMNYFLWIARQNCEEILCFKQQSQTGSQIHDYFFSKHSIQCNLQTTQKKKKPYFSQAWQLLSVKGFIEAEFCT